MALWQIFIIVFSFLMTASGCQIYQALTHERFQVAEAAPQFEQVTERISISGAVKDPGVYELPKGALVYDAILKSGGLSKTASVNQAFLAQDIPSNKKVVVPSASPKVPLKQQNTQKSGSSGPIQLNINQANAEQWVLLPGIGPATAEKIIAYRQEKGPFQSFEALENVKGIGPKKLAKMKAACQCTL